MSIHTPDWVKNAIFYQIFPDRFARSDRTSHPRGTQFKPWGSPPEEQGYQGGDLYGVVERLDYLQELGVTALYLNPIFASASNHRYHTFDYYEVDPLLGGNAALRELLDEAHKREMRVVLDGVFNHTGRGFWQFNHILENGGNSPYLDWFHIEDWPLRPYAHDKKNPPNYKAWANNPMLPKLNTDNSGVRDLLLDIARYWIEFGIDGWRLDVPNEIDDDAFWQDFRRVVKQANPEAYIVGEIWHDARRWLRGDQFDAVMNYIITSPTLAFFGAETVRTDYEKDHYDLTPIGGADFGHAIDRMMSLYPWEINQVQFNLLDSHDTARALWLLGEDKSALRLATLFLMTMPGAPCIYYGDEIGMSAADDPYCREAFPWHDESAWDRDLLAFYQRALALRNDHPVLRTGGFEALLAEGPVYAIWRVSETAQAIVAFNASEEPVEVDVPLPEEAFTLYTHVWREQLGRMVTAVSNTLPLTIPARDGVVLVRYEG
jgi:cyclomaltodextrinase